MSRVAYVNGRYLRHREAAVHIEDRGYQFADGVYEVIAVRDGALIDEDLHLKRLGRSLGELRIVSPMGTGALRAVMGEVVRRNGVRDGILYIQMTRGVAPRDHAFPKAPKTAVVMTARRTRPPSTEAAEAGVRVITLRDQRWARCDIKSVSLLPNILAKQQAREAGAYEAWQVDPDGKVTEGTSTNAWIVTDGDEVVTHEATNAILNGVTRLGLMAVIERAGLRFVERAFSVEEAKRAREAFLTSTTALVLAVVRIDDTVVGAGTPGPLTRRLRAFYLDHVNAQLCG